MKQKKLTFICIFLSILFLSFLVITQLFLPLNLKGFFFSFSWIDYLLIIANLICFVLLKNIFNKILIFSWLIWMYIGNIACYNTFLFWPTHQVIDTGIANNIYAIYMTVFSLSFIIYELIRNKKIIDKPMEINYENSFYKSKIIMFILYIFPILSLLEIHSIFGFFPILTGDNITTYMYDANFGILNQYFSLLPIFTVIYIFLKSTENIKLKRYPIILLHSILFVISCFLLVINGARFKLLIVIISILIIQIRNKKINLKNFTVFLSVGLAVYIPISIVRSGGMLNLDQLLYGFRMINLEFRGWAYSLQFLNNTHLNNYDWFSSAVIRLFSSGFVNSLGINYSDIAAKSSEVYFMNFFNTNLGIRIGLIGELNYAYSFWGTIIFFFFGLFTAYINIKIVESQKVDRVVFLSVIFSLNILTIMGQTDTYTSAIKAYIYIVILLKTIHFFQRIPKSSKLNRRNYYFGGCVDNHVHKNCGTNGMS